MLEDAFVTRDRGALTALFEEAAVLAAEEWHQPARGKEEICRTASSMWQDGRTYLAEPRRILQAGETALVVADRSVNVVRRGSDGAWRYTISLLSLVDERAKEEQ